MAISPLTTIIRAYFHCHNLSNLKFGAIVCIRLNAISNGFSRSCNQTTAVGEFRCVMATPQNYVSICICIKPLNLLGVIPKTRRSSRQTYSHQYCCCTVGNFGLRPERVVLLCMKFAKQNTTTPPSPPPPVTFHVDTTTLRCPPCRSI